MLLKIILFSGFSGITVFIGGLLANYFNHHIKEKPIKYEIIHAMMSFGAGIILSALALVLVPQGMEELELFPLVGTFLFGSHRSNPCHFLFSEFLRYNWSHARSYLFE